MTDLEDCLRSELKELSERAQPGSIRPLRVPPARKWSQAVRWLAPAAAVVAVIGVIAGVTLVSHPAGRQPTSPEGPGRMPPYYVIVQSGHVGLDSTVIVRDSATGRTLATVRLPFVEPGGVEYITGAADDRTFVLNDGYELFRLRLAADGRSARLSRLPITLPSALDNVALAPDGSTVAIESQNCKFVSKTNMQVICHYSAIRLISLRTGATRTWSTRAPAKGGGMWISWDGNAHVLFSWAPADPASSQPSGYRLLDVTGRGGDLLSARMLPLPPLPVFTGYSLPESAFITPDGRAVIASTLSAVGPSQSPTAVIMKIVEWSARTGRLLRVLLEVREHLSVPLLSEDCWVFALGPTGIHALIECPYPKVVFGRWDNGQFTPLPGMSSGSSAAW